MTLTLLFPSLIWTRSPSTHYTHRIPYSELYFCEIFIFVLWQKFKFSRYYFSYKSLVKMQKLKCAKYFNHKNKPLYACGCNCKTTHTKVPFRNSVQTVTRSGPCCETMELSEIKIYFSPPIHLFCSARMSIS